MRYFMTIILCLLVASCAKSSRYYTESSTNTHPNNLIALIKARGNPDIKATNRDGNTFFIYKTGSYRNTTTPMPPEIGVHFTPGGQPIILTNAHPNMNAMPQTISGCLTIYSINP